MLCSRREMNLANKKAISNQISVNVLCLSRRIFPVSSPRESHRAPDRSFNTSFFYQKNSIIAQLPRIKILHPRNFSIQYISGLLSQKTRLSLILSFILLAFSAQGLIIRIPGSFLKPYPDAKCQFHRRQ